MRAPLFFVISGYGRYMLAQVFEIKKLGSWYYKAEPASARACTIPLETYFKNVAIALQHTSALSLECVSSWSAI